MKRIPIQQLSFLGLLLFIASAVTAKILPKSKGKVNYIGGALIVSTDGKISCKPGIDNQCDYTDTDGPETSTSRGDTGSRNGETTGTECNETGTLVCVSV